MSYMLRPKPITGKGWVALPCWLHWGWSSYGANVDKVGIRGSSEANAESAKPARGPDAPHYKDSRPRAAPHVDPEDMYQFSVLGTQMGRGKSTGLHQNESPLALLWACLSKKHTRPTSLLRSRKAISLKMCSYHLPGKQSLSWNLTGQAGDASSYTVLRSLISCRKPDDYLSGNVSAQVGICESQNERALSTFTLQIQTPSKEMLVEGGQTSSGHPPPLPTPNALKGKLGLP